MPFTSDQFFAVFAVCNEAAWPLQVVLYVLGLGAVVMALVGGRAQGRGIAAILGALWMCVGVGYHWLFFTAINPTAKIFAGAFVLQGLLFWWEGLKEGSLEFKLRPDMFGVLGLVFIGYALLLYPLLSIFFGHGWPELPLFGLMPCPTTIFTFGMLLWASRRVQEFLLVIPILWSLLGTTAVFMGAYQDLGLLLAGVTSAVLVRYHNRVLFRRL